MIAARSHVAWDQIAPEVIAQCSQRHIQSVLEDARRDIALMQAALTAAERFIAGFDGCELQEGIEDLLRKVRGAIEPGPVQ